MISKKLKAFLDEHRTRYIVISHSSAYTAREVAASVHVAGKDVIKCVMVNADGRPWMVATTSNQRVNFDLLRAALGAETVRLAHESEFRTIFEDCEVGAMPPFGNLYGIPVIADSVLWDDEEIVFNGGGHTTVVRMAFADYHRLVSPRKAAITDPA
jgi:Ala-tRNA(Pro) deacylase